MDIPSDILESGFIMNPVTDDLIFAVGLQNGMIVFQEDPNTRCFIHLTTHSMMSELNETYQKIALKRNRWMMVTNLWDDADKKAFRFVGVFADGLKATVYAEYGSGWYVKKDSNLCPECINGVTDEFICISEGCPNFKNPFDPRNWDALRIQYNITDYNGRQCVRCRYGHIYDGVCSTDGCTRAEVIENVAMLRSRITNLVDRAMVDSKTHDDLAMWTSKRNRAVNLIIREIKDRKALLHSSSEKFDRDGLLDLLSPQLCDVLNEASGADNAVNVRRIIGVILDNVDSYEKTPKPRLSEDK